MRVWLEWQIQLYIELYDFNKIFIWWIAVDRLALLLFRYKIVENKTIDPGTQILGT